VGVKALDDQHIKLVHDLNKLHAVMLKGNAQSVAGDLASGGMERMYSHFSAEERLMEDTKFPGLDQHRAEHRAIAAKVAEFMALYEQDDQTMYPPLLRFMGNWLHDHMLTVDKQYTAWMNNHGIH
jgi:hemerythrin-like metal-binding protein